MSKESLKKQSALSIKKGSKSFSMAGLILSKSIREDAFLLYMWCRFCDDAIDEASESEVLGRLIEIRNGTIEALNGGGETDNSYRALKMVFDKYSIPQHYPVELINGMEMDVRGTKYHTLEDLMLYCYRVAGVVGLMMGHIIGVSDEEALHNACDLGRAMQLTNICRDVYTDARMGRVYLPEDMLEAAGITSADILDPAYKQPLASVVAKVLDKAEVLYESGDKGIPFLQFRTAVAIQSARYIYSDIGRLIKNYGEHAWDQRLYTSKPRKLFLVAKAFGSVILKKVGQWVRTRSKWRRTSIISIVTHS